MPCSTEDVRTHEVSLLRDWFPPGLSVLEIGGGSGLQASILDGWGCEVVSIDLADGPIAAESFDVQPYDGTALPFASDSFDRVFSSNVLEHVTDLSRMHDEIRRVLRPGGLAIHLMPSPTWRLWTSVAHYIYLARYIAARAKGRRTVHTAFGGPPEIADVIAKRGVRESARRALKPAAHGEYSSATSELWFYSRRRWKREFHDHGFGAIAVHGNGLFYAGWGVMPRLEMRHRRSLARILGPACNVFVLRVEHE